MNQFKISSKDLSLANLVGNYSTRKQEKLDKSFLQDLNRKSSELKESAREKRNESRESNASSKTDRKDQLVQTKDDFSKTGKRSETESDKFEREGLSQSQETSNKDLNKETKKEVSAEGSQQIKDENNQAKDAEKIDKDIVQQVDDGSQKLDQNAMQVMANMLQSTEELPKSNLENLKNQEGNELVANLNDPKLQTKETQLNLSQVEAQEKTPLEEEFSKDIAKMESEILNATKNIETPEEGKSTSKNTELGMNIKLVQPAQKEVEGEEVATINKNVIKNAEMKPEELDNLILSVTQNSKNNHDLGSLELKLGMNESNENSFSMVDHKMLKVDSSLFKLATKEVAGSNKTLESKEIMEQVLNKVKVAELKNSNLMEVKLEPESLGKMTVRVATENGTISAAIFVENDKVKNAIENNLAALKESLLNQGITVNQIDVNISGNQDEMRRHMEFLESKGKSRKGITIESLEEVEEIDNSGLYGEENTLSYFV